MKSCYIKHCKENVFVTSNMADAEVLKCTLNECSLECTSSTVPIPTPLCKHHYHVTYKHLQPQQSNCSTCEASLKHVNNRVCPEQSFSTEFVAFMPMPKPLDYNCLITCLHSQDISYTEPKKCITFMLELYIHIGQTTITGICRDPR